MNILISCNDNYLTAAKVCCKSIINNHPNENIHFYVMHLGAEKKIIPSLCQQFPEHDINNIEIPDSVKEWITIPQRINSHVTIETYFRLFIDYLPKDISRILYMDVDAFCNKNFEELYNIDMRDYYVAGCRDYGFDMQPKLKDEVFHNLGFNKNDLYVNAGVLLFNLKKIKEDFSQKDIIDHMKRIEDKIIFHDQDIINSFFKGKILEFPKEMNMRPFHYSYNKINERYIKNHAYIVHFGHKPWMPSFTDFVPEIYWDHAKMIGLENQFENWKAENTEYKKNHRKAIFKAILKRNLICFFRLTLKGKMAYYLI